MVNGRYSLLFFSRTGSVRLQPDQDVSTTMIYTLVLNGGGPGGRSPLDA
jgi:hypothetical protein